METEYNRNVGNHTSFLCVYSIYSKMNREVWTLGNILVKCVFCFQIANIGIHLKPVWLPDALCSCPVRLLQSDVAIFLGSGWEAQILGKFHAAVFQITSRLTHFGNIIYCYPLTTYRVISKRKMIDSENLEGQLTVFKVKKTYLKTY